MTRDPNNNLKLGTFERWALGIVAALVASGTVAGIGAYSGAREKDATHDQQFTDHGRRIEAIESEQHETRKDIRDIREFMARIDQKLK